MESKSTLQRMRGGVEAGFTLIELLIVITILGILAAVVVFAVGTTGKNAAQSACQSDVKTVETAQEANKAQTGAYAADVNTLVSGGYLREAPSSQEYAVTTDNSGAVKVAPVSGGNNIKTGGTLTVGDTTDTPASICK
jgi:general secretion pathway protein G